MKKNISTLLLIMTIAIGIFSTLTNAAPTKRTVGVTRRQEQQKARIQHGMGNGSISLGEAAKLKAEEHKVNSDKKAAKADGVVTKQERQQLRTEQNQASRNIRKSKHN